MTWDIEYTDEFATWFFVLSMREQDAIEAAVRLLETDGPGLGRPIVDTIKGSRHANMKELRPLSSSIRIFFAFDPRRSAILLIGGDKRGRWTGWYRDMIPVADRLYDEHLRSLRNEGLLP